jgi:histidinol phosphatase-like enzyme (inositol monophosphatase family)
VTGPACPPELVGFASDLGDLAGGILRRCATESLCVEIKPDGSPVTNVDREVEAAIRAEIVRRRPSDGIIGEEYAPERVDAEFVWIIDPLDGTKEYVQGLPLWGFLLALAWRGRFVLGLAEQPLLHDRWLASDGHGTQRNGHPIRTRPCAALSDAVINTMGYDTFCRQHHDRLVLFRGQARGTVTADSFIVFGLLAEGRVDLIASAGFALHDYAALDVIVRNAGGIVTDWCGAPLGLRSNGTILAAGDACLHKAALSTLRGEQLGPGGIVAS